jgi:hypothetical protein
MNINKECLKRIGIQILLAPVFPLSFSTNTRNAIRKRDSYTSVWSGSSETTLQCCHEIHGQNSIENGRLLTLPQHYVDHFFRSKNSGLSRKDQFAATHGLWQMLSIEQKSEAIWLIDNIIPFLGKNEPSAAELDEIARKIYDEAIQNDSLPNFSLPDSYFQEEPQPPHLNQEWQTGHSY